MEKSLIATSEKVLLHNASQINKAELEWAKKHMQQTKEPLE
jgi:hypothetical protein